MEERSTIIAEGRIIAGKIRLERPLARGGMGAVWVAHHLKLDAPVAVKFMEPSLAASESARARFEREAKAAAQLQSPWVVQVQDYGVEGDTPYIVMELLLGEDLGQRLQKRGHLDLAESARILEPVCKALRRAHEIGLVHRDLKPGNIFLARQRADEDEIVKLLDFGIAKSITQGSPQSGDVTRSGNLVGSPLYMSPEQIRKSKEVDHRSDLWSLGVILYQALTGHPPFVEDDVGAVLVAICTDPIPQPSALAPHLGPEVDRFFERALSRDPAKRFQSARELYEAFAVVAGAPSRITQSDDIDRGALGARDAATALAETEPPSPAGAKVPAGGATLGLAETVPALEAAKGAPDGTLSPSGVTQEKAHEPARRQASIVLVAAALLAAMAVGGWWWRSGSVSDLSVNEDKPGSPTLPLPPPKSSSTAIASTSDIPPATSTTAAAPPVDSSKAEGAIAIVASAAPRPQSASAQQDKSPAGIKRERTAGASAIRKASPPGAASAGPADDAKELGLE